MQTKTIRANNTTSIDDTKGANLSVRMNDWILKNDAAFANVNIIFDHNMRYDTDVISNGYIVS